MPTLHPPPPSAIIPNPWMSLLQSTLVHLDDHLCKLQRTLLSKYASHFGNTPTGTFSGTELKDAKFIDGTLFIRAAGLSKVRMSYGRGTAVQPPREGLWDRRGWPWFFTTWTNTEACWVCAHYKLMKFMVLRKVWSQKDTRTISCNYYSPYRIKSSLLLFYIPLTAEMVVDFLPETRPDRVAIHGFLRWQPALLICLLMLALTWSLLAMERPWLKQSIRIFSMRVSKLGTRY